jgi:hypothetical protein
MDLLMCDFRIGQESGGILHLHAFFGADLAHGAGRLAKIKFNEHTSVGMPINRANQIVNDGEVRPSERRRGLSQNYDKYQNQDREDQPARAHEDNLAHYIGFQQVLTTHKTTSRKIEG